MNPNSHLHFSTIQEFRSPNELSLEENKPIFENNALSNINNNNIGKNTSNLNPAIQKKDTNDSNSNNISYNFVNIDIHHSDIEDVKDSKKNIDDNQSIGNNNTTNNNNSNETNKNHGDHEDHEDGDHEDKYEPDFKDGSNKNQDINKQQAFNNYQQQLLQQQFLQSQQQQLFNLNLLQNLPSIPYLNTPFNYPLQQIGPQTNPAVAAVAATVAANQIHPSRLTYMKMGLPNQSKQNYPSSTSNVTPKVQQNQSNNSISSNNTTNNSTPTQNPMQNNNPTDNYSLDNNSNNGILPSSKDFSFQDILKMKQIQQYQQLQYQQLKYQQLQFQQLQQLQQMQQLPQFQQQIPFPTASADSSLVDPNNLKLFLDQIQLQQQQQPSTKILLSDTDKPLTNNNNNTNNNNSNSNNSSNTTNNNNHDITSKSISSSNNNSQTFQFQQPQLKQSNSMLDQQNADSHLQSRSNSNSSFGILQSQALSQSHSQSQPLNQDSQQLFTQLLSQQLPSQSIDFNNQFNQTYTFPDLSPALATFQPSIPISMIPNLISQLPFSTDFKLDVNNDNNKNINSKDTSNDPAFPKPYRCAHCTWSFSRPSDLRRHLKSHNAPQYHCPYWNQEFATCPHKSGGSFNRLDVLKRHLKLVHYEPDVKELFRFNRKKKISEINNNNNNKGLSNKNDGGYCLSCDKHFDTVKEYIIHVTNCAINTPMYKWKYKKNGAILNVKEDGDTSNLKIRTDIDDDYSSESHILKTNKIKEIIDPDSIYNLNNDNNLSSNLDNEIPTKKRTYMVSVNDLDNKPEIMHEALSRKRGRPKKDYGNKKK